VRSFIIGHVLGDAEVLELRIRKYLVDRIDRAAGTPAVLNSFTLVSLDFFSVS
jgi:hypothetical protein